MIKIIDISRYFFGEVILIKGFGVFDQLLTVDLTGTLKSFHVHLVDLMRVVHVGIHVGVQPLFVDVMQIRFNQFRTFVLKTLKRLGHKVKTELLISG